MQHPSIEGYNHHVLQLQKILNKEPVNLVGIRKVYEEVAKYKPYVLLTLRCADVLAEAAMQSRHHDAGMILISDALDTFEAASEHYGTPEQTHHILHNLITLKLRILACYKTPECDEAILTITESTLRQYPGIWRDNQSMHGVFYATQRAQALNRLHRHDLAASLYLEMQELGKNISEPMLETVSSLGWAYSIIMGGKTLALNGKWQEAVTAWRSAASVIDTWKSTLKPEDDYDTDYLVSHFWNCAYAKWLADKGGDPDELIALYRTRNEKDKRSLLTDIATHQLPFEVKLISSLQ